MVVPIDTILGRGLSSARAREPRVSAKTVPPAPRFSRPTGHVSREGLLDIAQFAQPLKERLAAMLPLRPGQRVLDVGCGPGTDTGALASRVGPGGLVAGIDRDPAMVDAARDRVRGQPAGRLARHLRADAIRLPFATGAFDVCRCERVLQHLRDGQSAIVEMARVTKPSGIVVVADSDWASLTIDAADVKSERRIVRSIADALADGYAGRALPRRLADAGLQDIVVDVVLVHWTSFETFRRTSFMAAGLHRDIVAAGELGADQWNAFEKALEAADRRGRFFATATIVVAAGRRAA